MATKRTVTVNLAGHTLTVRTTEPEEVLERNVARVNEVLALLASRTRSADTLRLFALGLLHLGREIDMLEDRLEGLSSRTLERLTAWTEQVHRRLDGDV